MSSTDSRRPPANRGELLLAAAVLAALCAAVLPVARVIDSGAWLVGSLAVAVLVLAAGYHARRFRLPAVAVTLIELAVWVVFMTLVFLGDTAFLWVVPSIETFRAASALVESAMDEIVLGAAPLEPTLPLAFVVVGAMGLLAIIVDHVVVTARMPLLATVGIVAVSLIPGIAVPGPVDVMGFVLLAITILFLIRTETRSRETPPEQAADHPGGQAAEQAAWHPAERTAGVAATAVGIGAIAVVVAVVATPLLPQPIARAGAGIGSGPGIDATLQLGDDLRRPQEAEVLRLRTDSAVVPYLRATTLSSFEGDTWEPDGAQTIAIDGASSLGAVSVDAEIRVTDYTATIDVTNLESPWAPVPYPAVSVEGLEGAWGAVPYNRTVVARSGSTQGQSYQVVYSLPRPTLEQIRASAAAGEQVLEESTRLPADIPPIIAELAAQVTAGATNDYDKLAALQRWFRGSEFSYSLDAPVEDGFDGSGAEAIARFLEARQGYCVHFASAFALMARTLHMPSRVVVGYLPGVPTSTAVDGQPSYAVSSSQLHAWPEVYFGGIGWVAFEPTSGLGTPTSFSPAAALPGQGDDSAATTPETAPSATAPTGAELAEQEDPQDTAVAGGARSTVDPLPVLGVVLLVLVVLAIPSLVRELRRRQLDRAARRGDAAAAWQTVQDAAIDVGIPVPQSETPRAFAGRLIAEHGVPASDMDTVLIAIEKVSYSRAGTRSFWMGDASADAAAAVRAALLASVPSARRILAIVAPRSLVIRPGSAYAGVVADRVRVP